MPTITIQPTKIIQRAAREITSLTSQQSQLFDPESTANTPALDAYIGFKAEANQTPQKGTASIWYDVPIPAGARIVSAVLQTTRQRSFAYRTVFRMRRFTSGMGNPNGNPYQYTGEQPTWLSASGLNVDYPQHLYNLPLLAETSVYDGSQTRDVLQQLVFQSAWVSGAQMELHCDGQGVVLPGQRLVTGLVIENANLVVTYVDQVAALIGGAFAEFVADIGLGDVSGTSWSRPVSADAELGDEFRDGRFTSVRADGVVGAVSQFGFSSARKVPARVAGVLGESAIERLRYLVYLRLAAGKVVKDVGYMWVPVVLQLPADPLLADWPWSFFYPGGRRIPFIVRNRVEREVHALVYMRPSPSVAQDFYVRIG